MLEKIYGIIIPTLWALCQQITDFSKGHNENILVYFSIL